MEKPQSLGMAGRKNLPRLPQNTSMEAKAVSEPLMEQLVFVQSREKRKTGALRRGAYSGGSCDKAKDQPIDGSRCGVWPHSHRTALHCCASPGLWPAGRLSSTSSCPKIVRRLLVAVRCNSFEHLQKINKIDRSALALHVHSAR
jgi:hypothetical protein